MSQRCRNIRSTRLWTQSGPRGDDGRDDDGGGEVGCELVIAGGDASPILEAAEHALDEVALAIGGLVERMMSLAGRVVRDDRNRATFEKKPTQTIAVVGGVGGQASAWRNSGDQGCRDSNVAEMARRHFDSDGASARVDDGVDFRGAPAA